MTCPTGSNDSGNIPCWSISTWIYGSYPGATMDAQQKTFNEGNWLNQVATAINDYNNAQANVTSKINQIYAYASDVELPWIAPSYADNGVATEPRLKAPPIPYGQCGDGNPCACDWNKNNSAYDCILLTDSIAGSVGTACPNNMVCGNTFYDPYGVNPGDPSNAWYQSDPTKPDCQYGFSFVSTIAGNAVNTGASNPVIPLTQLGTTTDVPSTLGVNVTGLTNTSIIIDGRIDNGYLQGLNEFITPADASNLATLIVNGGYSQIPLVPNPTAGQLPKHVLPADKTQWVFQTGVGVFGPNNTSPKYSPTIHGIQLDLEPFDSSNPNQMAFYAQVGTLLKAKGQYFSIFTYPKAMNQTTADLLNGTNISGNNPNGTSYNNGYMIVALYDLVDMKNGIPSSCTRGNYLNATSICDTSAVAPPCSATGDATTLTYDFSVPHSVSGYYNSVLLTVKQTIALSAQYGIKYKFGIPVSSSVHEFENWGQYVCQFNDFFDVKPVNGFCRMYNGLPLNPNSGNPSQLQYVQQAIRAIHDGISQMGTKFTNNVSLFRGIDFYSFGYRTIWSPQNPIVDYVTGNVFYGNTPAYVPANPDGFTVGSEVNAPFIYTTPSYPTYETTDPNSVLAWLAKQNLDFRPTS